MSNSDAGKEGRSDVKIIIEAEPKEIADLLLAVEDRQGGKAADIAVSKITEMMREMANCAGHHIPEVR